MKRLLVLVLAIAMLGLFPAAPVQAHHDNDLGHWNQPPLVVSTAPTWYDPIIQDAAYYWQDHAFYRGYYPPLPAREDGLCTARVGRITICLVESWDSRLQGKAGLTSTWLYGDGSGHIEAQVIYMSNHLTGAARQSVMRHEFGHALGLGHRNAFHAQHAWACSVMNDPTCGPYATWEDRNSIIAWQPPHHGH